MSMTETTNKIQELASTWAQAQDLNDRRINEIEKKGSADALTVEHLQKVTDALEAFHARPSTQNESIKQNRTCYFFKHSFVGLQS